MAAKFASACLPFWNAKAGDRATSGTASRPSSTCRAWRRGSTGPRLPPPGTAHDQVDPAGDVARVPLPVHRRRTRAAECDDTRFAGGGVRPTASGSFARDSPGSLSLQLGLAPREVARTNEPSERADVLVVQLLRWVRQAPASPTCRRWRVRRYQIESRRRSAAGGTEEKHATAAPDRVRAAYPSERERSTPDAPREFAVCSDTPLHERAAQQSVVHILGTRDRRDLIHANVSRSPPPARDPRPDLARNDRPAAHRLIRTEINC